MRPRAVVFPVCLCRPEGGWWLAHCSNNMMCDAPNAAGAATSPNAVGRGSACCGTSESMPFAARAAITAFFVFVPNSRAGPSVGPVCEAGPFPWRRLDVRDAERAC